MGSVWVWAGWSKVEGVRDKPLFASVPIFVSSSVSHVSCYSRTHLPLRAAHLAGILVLISCTSHTERQLSSVSLLDVMIEQFLYFLLLVHFPSLPFRVTHLAGTRYHTMQVSHRLSCNTYHFYSRCLEWIWRSSMHCGVERKRGC